MIGALRFVQGVIKANKVSPELEHYKIKDGEVVGFNGYMALGAPIDLTIEAMPKASVFFKAISACGDVVSINLTDNGRLVVESGAFKAYLPCLPREVHEAKPTGNEYPVPSDLVENFARLLPFISQDAYRPWGMGLEVRDGLYTATNNVIINQIWSGHSLPTFNCPRFAVAEVVRIKETPKTIRFDGNSISFIYESGRWMKTLILADEWPVDLVSGILDSGHGDYQEIPETLFDGLETIKPFVPAETTAVTFNDGYLSTGNEGTGAQVVVDGLRGGPVFSSDILLSLKGEAIRIDFDAYPNPCGFIGESSRGVILGMNA